MTVGVVQESLAGPAGVPLMMTLMPLWVAPAVTGICVEAVGTSGGFVFDSFAPFQNSAGPGSTAGGSSGPTLFRPVKVGSMASMSTV